MFLRLTPNHRLADYLRQINPETATFQVDDFFAQEYRALTQKFPLPSLLSREAGEVLWEKAIGDVWGDTLLKPQALISMAREAWTLIHQWRLKLAFSNEVRGRAHEEAFPFLNWCECYEAFCREAEVRDEATLPDVLLNLAKQKQYQPPSTIECVGFEEYTPQLKHFLGTVAGMGTKVLERNLVPSQQSQPIPASVSAVKAGHPDEELRWAFEFAGDQLIHSPGSRICIVVPDLVLNRNKVGRLAKHYFKADDYNISAPLPLSHYPFMEAAFLGLALLNDEFNFAEFSQFLRSPYFSKTEEEKLFKAEWEALTRPFVGLRLTLPHCQQLMERLNEKRATLTGKTLALQLRAVLNLSTHTLGRKKLSRDWTLLFTKVLEILGWGGAPLSVSDTLLHAKWQAILDSYSKMSAILGPHTLKDALGRLATQRDAQTFLPPSKASASIHILGLLEAVGIPFDAIWVTGLHRENWPGKPEPHPFIPFSLQKTHDLPHSSPARELAVSRRLTERLKCAGKTVVFSYPSQIEEKVCEVSPLLANLERREPSSLSGYSLSAKAVVSANQTTSTQSLPIPTPTRLKGGAFTLKLQATCPFKAFATARLQAHALVSPLLALSKAERGNLIHEALNQIWGILKTQAALLCLSTLELDTLIEQTIQSVLKKWRHSARRLSDFYLALEHKRMVRLIQAFLMIEKARAPFEVIAQEYEETVLLASLPMKIRIDRIDRLSTGEEIIIDYKTGDAPISQWFGPRLLDPQLPLYAVTRPHRPYAIAFALISAKKLGYQGVALGRSSPLLKGLHTLSALERFGAATSDVKQFQAWEQSIQSLSEGFKNSELGLDPVKGETTCQVCHLKPLCRVKSLGTTPSVGLKAII